MGLVMNAIIFAIMAGKYTALKANSGGLIACFIFLQFFFNFGANATTFVSECPCLPVSLLYPCLPFISPPSLLALSLLSSGWMVY
jgi:hypothetical protein